MGTTLHNRGFTATTRLDGYARWLAEESFAAEYVQHRRILQILDAGDGRRWVLNAPSVRWEWRQLRGYRLEVRRKGGQWWEILGVSW
jgi:hypothetical protein